jgi:methyl-accepting chemotaxis protein
MRLPRNASVLTRIMTILALMALLLMGLCVYALHQMGVADRHYKDLIAREVNASVEVQMALAERYNWNRLLNGLVAVSGIRDRDDMRDHQTQMAAAAAEVHRHLARIRELVPAVGERADNIAGQFDGIVRASEAEQEAALRFDPAEAWRLYVADVRPALGAISEEMAGLTAAVLRRTDEVTDAATANYHDAVVRIALAAAIGLLLAALLAWRIASSGIVGPLRRLAGVMDGLANGDTGAAAEIARLPRHAGSRNEIDRATAAVGATAGALNALVGDMRDLIAAAQAGSLSARADASRHQGEFASLVQGANTLVEAMSRPIQEAAEVIQKLASGDVQGRISGAYEGDFRALKANMNRSLDAMGLLLGELDQMFQRLAEGDLTQILSGVYPGDFARLRSNVNLSVEQLRATLLALAETTRQASEAATATSAVARQVSADSAQQLVTLTEIATAIGRTAEAVGGVSDSAQRGNEMTLGAVRLVEMGSQNLANLVSAVERVAEGHGRIERITGTITRIADKTHVLAINAGLEAARVGEQGRGFGFLAQEIGRLAEEAAVAAHDIAGIIGQAFEDIQRSTADAARAREAIGRITEATREAGSTVMAIAAAISEQSSVVQSLSGRIEVLQSAGQGNALAAEHISDTMETLADMISRSQDMVGRLKLT